MHNLLTDPVFGTKPLGPLALPGVLAALARDEIDSFPALRPHQGMFWHMFCVQLAAMSLRERGEIVAAEGAWRDVLRAMTPDHVDDAPWTLVVDDWSKPAFLQSPISDGVALTRDAPTPDALDLLITSKNHDLKQAVATRATPEDWVFALIALQTGEGYGGSGNQGIARMNGGSSSRVLVGLAPAGDGASGTPRLGAWFSRDLKVLLERPADPSSLGYRSNQGLGLTWLAPWPESNQLEVPDLDPLFIEVCRRVRLIGTDDCLRAAKGTSKHTRVNAKHLNGVLGDPWAPVDRAMSKSLTLGETGDFNYSRIMELMFSGDWERPLLARPAAFEEASSRLLLVLQALARGNSKTGGYRSRCLPLTGKVVAAFGVRDQRETLHEIGKGQAKVIDTFRKALGYALVLAVADGNSEKIQREQYGFAKPAQAALDRYADRIFFSFLWMQFEEGTREARSEFIRVIWSQTESIFDTELSQMPNNSLMRPKAEAKARGALRWRVMKSYGDILNSETRAEHA